MPTTNTPDVIPTAAPRGEVQKSFVTTRFLSGFADANHFALLANDYLSSLTATEKDAIIAEAAITRQFVATLPPFNNPADPIIREITGTHVDEIRAQPLFSQAFGNLAHKFCYINPSSVIALQASIEPRSDIVPTNEPELLEFALPRTWKVSAEVSLIPPAGPIQIMSSNPAMQGLSIELDTASAKVMLSAPQHLNLVQVKRFNGRLYLRNGYHRLSDAIRSGRTEFPALVIEAQSPEQVAIPGGETFRIGYVLNLQRPPLVGDFHTRAALTAKRRERRYGFIVNLDIKPINIGI